MLMQVAILVGALFLGVVAIALVYVLGMRAKSPLVLSPLIRLQRAIINPKQMRSAGTPGAYASVIRHRGRTSGRPYETPVGVVAADDGFLIALVYGSRTNWLQNVLASGSATIVHEGQTYEVDQPEIVPMQAVAARFTAGDQQGFRLLRVDQALRVRRVEPEEAGEQITDAPSGEGARIRSVRRDPVDGGSECRMSCAPWSGTSAPRIARRPSRCWPRHSRASARLDQVVGDDDRAPDRRRRMFEMTLKEGAKQHVIVAERDGRIEGVLTYADRPDCIPSVRDSLAAVRIAGPRLLTLIRDFREVQQGPPRGRRIATCRCWASAPRRRALVSAGSS